MKVLTALKMKLIPIYKYFHISRPVLAVTILSILLISAVVAGLFTAWQVQRQEATTLHDTLEILNTQREDLESQLAILRAEDQRVRNDELEEQLERLREANTQATTEYDRLLNLQETNFDTAKIQTTWAQVLAYLADHNYASAEAQLQTLKTDITSAEQTLVQQAALPTPATSVTSNDAPGSGYQRQQVQTEIGNYVVSLVAGDLASTRVVVDTASTSDCGNDCPVLSLSEYVSRNGAYAGINGTYFCPASYPSCAGKTNTYDLLVMNKDKTYFNSDNNVYSTNPAVIFSNNSIRFVSAASQWGRDTSVDGVLSNFPLLLSGGEIRFAGDGDPKKGSKGNRSFVANKGNTVYIGVVHSATVAEAAWALKGLGMDNALNLDSGGSTALWSNGYRVGPGRNIPNAILFLRE